MGNLNYFRDNPRKGAAMKNRAKLTYPGRLMSGGRGAVPVPAHRTRSVLGSGDTGASP